MSNKFVLYDSCPFLKPISADEVQQVQKLLGVLASCGDHMPSVSLPKKVTDHMLLLFCQALRDKKAEINPKAWAQFLESLFMAGLMEEVRSPSLRNYLHIQLAKRSSLTRYMDVSSRKKLAYAALHGGHESRNILLLHAKHFALDDPVALSDLAYKGILLGGASVIDLHQFMPLSFEQIKQLIFLIGKVDPQKARSELEKMHHEFPQAKKLIEPHLEAS